MRILNHDIWVNVPEIIRLTAKRKYSYWKKKLSVMESAQKRVMLNIKKYHVTTVSPAVEN
jgi:hypothetical protein